MASASLPPEAERMLPRRSAEREREGSASRALRAGGGQGVGEEGKEGVEVSAPVIVTADSESQEMPAPTKQDALCIALPV